MTGKAWFASGSGGPLDLHNARRALRSCRRNPDVPRITLYDLRRTAGSLLVDAGLHLEQVADLLGHSDCGDNAMPLCACVAPNSPPRNTVRHAMG